MSQDLEELIERAAGARRMANQASIVAQAARRAQDEASRLSMAADRALAEAVEERIIAINTKERIV